MRKPITRAEVLEAVTEEYKNQFPVIFLDASKCLEVDFSIDVKKKVSASNSLTLSYEDILSGDQRLPKKCFPEMYAGFDTMQGTMPLKKHLKIPVDNESI